MSALAVVALVTWNAEPFSWDSFGPGHDARPYWMAPLADPYGISTTGQFGAYLYSPAFLQLIAPLKLLTWTGFLVVWTALMVCVLAALSGWKLLALLVGLCFIEIWGGNVTILMAAAIALGFKWPAAWSFILLTKVTPGVGLIWFAARRDWRHLGIAVGATGIIVVGSAILGPSAWLEWFRVLQANAPSTGTEAAIQVPLIVRLPLAVGVLVWGALTNRRWTVPVGCVLALPILWFGSLTLLVAVLPLLDKYVAFSPGPVGTAVRPRSRTGGAGSTGGVGATGSPDSSSGADSAGSASSTPAPDANSTPAPDANSTPASPAAGALPGQPGVENLIAAIWAASGEARVSPDARPGAH